MPAYAFEALDDQGATRKGVMEADTARAVRAQLRAQALVPLQVQPVTGALGDASGAGSKGGWGAPNGPARPGLCSAQSLPSSWKTSVQSWTRPSSASFAVPWPATT